MKPKEETMYIDLFGSQIAQFVKEQREKQGFTIRVLAAKLNIATSSISKVERAEPTRQKTVDNILGALGYSLEVQKKSINLRASVSISFTPIEEK